MSLPRLERLDLVNRSLAVRRRGDSGPTVVFCHGNSCSSRSFEKQLCGPLGERFRLIAIDLPGHGDSPPAAVPDTAYTLPGYADALVAATEALGAENAVFVGWSLGGHVLLEASDRLARAAGFLIFGAPPVASFADFTLATTGDPALGVAFREDSTPDDVERLLSLFLRPGQPVPQVLVDDFRRTDKRARSALMASAGRNELRDEVKVVGELRRPLAVLHGAQEAIVRREYFDTIAMPTLWRGQVQEVPDAGHAAQWENPHVFDRLLEEFVADCSD
jgi:pimeloyl-ACP methyl ester carboxylesterase